MTDLSLRGRGVGGTAEDHDDTKGCDMKAPYDPVDHARTTRPHAGESMTNTKNLPGLVVAGAASGPTRGS